MKTLILLAFLFMSVTCAHAQNFGLINQQQQSSRTQTSSPYAPMVSHIYGESSDPDSRYTLGPNDILTITVQRHPEVSGKYQINMEGKIQYEFVGDILLTGMTKDEAAAAITKALKKFIIRPDVTVIISEYNSKIVYVVGEVGAPGRIYMRSDTMTVRDALLAANLPELTAATEKATLFTPSDSGHVELRKVNVYDLLYKGDLRQNYVMRPGDTLYLPATLWAKIARFLNPVTQPIGQAAGAGAAIAAF